MSETQAGGRARKQVLGATGGPWAPHPPPAAGASSRQRAPAPISLCPSGRASQGPCLLSARPRSAPRACPGGRRDARARAREPPPASPRRRRRRSGAARLSWQRSTATDEILQGDQVGKRRGTRRSGPAAPTGWCRAVPCPGSEARARQAEGGPALTASGMAWGSALPRRTPICAPAVWAAVAFLLSVPWISGTPATSPVPASRPPRRRPRSTARGAGQGPPHRTRRQPRPPAPGSAPPAAAGLVLISRDLGRAKCFQSWERAAEPLAGGFARVVESERGCC